ncbi:MAG: hypothetical protein AAFO94_19305, partial [Bacteroidota bacterium]
MEKKVFTILVLSFSMSLATLAQDFAPPPPAPTPSNVTDADAHGGKFDNIKVINETIDYAPYHIDKRFLLSFGGQVDPIDTKMKFHLFDQSSTDQFIEIKKKNLPELTANESLLWVVVNRQGKVTT